MPLKPSLLPSRSASSIINSLAALLTLMLLSGCEIINYRSHPELHKRHNDNSVVMAAPTEIKISQISTGGVSEEVDEYSDEANRLFAIKLANQEGDQGFATFEISEDVQEEYTEIISLAKTVMQQILTYSYHGLYPGFKHKSDNFRYSIGDISKILETSGSDQMLFLYGYDSFTTSGRKFVNGLATVLSAAASGGNTAYIAQEGTGTVYAMLVDKDGEVLWITQHLNPSLDLRKEKDIDVATAAILVDLKKAKTNTEK